MWLFIGLCLADDPVVVQSQQTAQQELDALILKQVELKGEEAKRVLEESKIPIQGAVEVVPPPVVVPLEEGPKEGVVEGEVKAPPEAVAEESKDEGPKVPPEGVLEE